MTARKIALFFQLMFIVLLSVGIINPGGVAAYIAGAYLWLIVTITWVVIALGSFSYMGSDAFRRNVHAKIRPFFVSTSPRTFRKWGMRLLVVVAVGLSGFYSLVFVYVVTLISCRVLAATYDQVSGK